MYYNIRLTGCDWLMLARWIAIPPCPMGGKDCIRPVGGGVRPSMGCIRSLLCALGLIVPFVIPLPIMPPERFERA